MEFWGVEVKPGETVKCEPGYGKYVHISLASLGESVSIGGGSNAAIYIEVNFQKLVIGTLCADKCAQITYDLVFENKFELSHTSKNASIYFCGYKTVAQKYKYHLDGEANSKDDVPVDQTTHGMLTFLASDSDTKGDDLAKQNLESVTATLDDVSAGQNVTVSLNSPDIESGSEEDVPSNLNPNATMDIVLPSQNVKASQLLRCFNLDKAVNFSYRELDNATNHFGRNKLISEGAFAKIYYAKLRGQKTAVKKMNPEWHHLFHCELSFLAKTHHLNLVAHLSLARSTNDGNTMEVTCIVGTCGYVAPEYISSGFVSPKVDVYAFGVVLYQLISAKEFFIQHTDKLLVDMFADALNNPEPIKHVRKLVDPRLGYSYPVDSVYKMALLGMACTQNDPWRRPSMQIVVLALRTLLSAT